MPAVVDRVQRIAARRELLARPGVAAAVLGDAVSEHDRRARRGVLGQPGLPVDLEGALALEPAPLLPRPEGGVSPGGARRGASPRAGRARGGAPAPRRP